MVEMMNNNKFKDMGVIEDLQRLEPFKHYTEYDLRDLCETVGEPMRLINSCISKEQLRKLCKQLVVENAVLRKKLKGYMDEQ